MTFTVTIHEQAGAAVVEVTGELDLYTAPQLREQLAGLMTRPVPAVVVDLQQVSFMDSMGVGILVGAFKRARANGGWVELVSTQEVIRKLLNVTGLSKVFPLHASVQDALSSRGMAS